jgi:hypothetical protein
MFITNEMNYGHLIDPENFNISLTQPELYEVFNNIKVNYFKVLLNEEKKIICFSRIGKLDIFIRIIINLLNRMQPLNK